MSLPPCHPWALDLWQEPLPLRTGQVAGTAACAHWTCGRNRHPYAPAGTARPARDSLPRVRMWTDLRTVAVHRDFRKLFAVRLVSQCGDGMFQAGLATLFFFSPESMATAGAVAAAFAVLLLPFTVVGPF